MVNDPGLTGKDRAMFGGMIADGNDKVERNMQQFADMSRTMMRDINTHLGHHLDGARIKTMRFNAGRPDLDPVAFKIPRPSLSHL